MPMYIHIQIRDFCKFIGPIDTIVYLAFLVTPQRSAICVSGYALSDTSPLLGTVCPLVHRI